MTVEALRTPQHRFDSIPDYPFAPHWFTWEGLAMHYVDEGSGPPVVLFHGEPTWSFLWRKTISALVTAGFRAVAPDFLGFGKSDKPVDPAFYTYDRHTAAAHALVEDLRLESAAAVVHDWGGPIGLRIATQSDWFTRLVILDTGLFGGRPPGEGFQRWRSFVERTPDLPVALVMGNAATTEWPAGVLAAYEAPFPGADYKAGAWRFPLLVPQSSEDEGAAVMREVATALSQWSRPAYLLWGADDPVIPPEVGARLAARIPGAAEPVLVPGAGHFLQEDRGDEVAAQIVRFLSPA